MAFVVNIQIQVLTLISLMASDQGWQVFHYENIQEQHLRNQFTQNEIK